METEFGGHLSAIGLREAVHGGVKELRVLDVEQLHELCEIGGDAFDVSAQLVQVVDIRVASADRVVNEQQINMVNLDGDLLLVLISHFKVPNGLFILFSIYWPHS